MQLPTILLLGGLAVLLRLVGARAARRWLVFVVSALLVYVLQPALPVRGLDFWLPTLTLALAALGWLLTARPELRGGPANRAAGMALAGVALAVALTRYLGPGDLLVGTRPPGIERVLPGLALLAAAVLGLARVLRGRLAPNRLLGASAALLVLLLVVLKTPALAQWSAGGLRALAGQNAGLASALDIRWLGISYLVFRLIHTLRDRQAGRLADADLVTYVSYVVFFPAFLAGPIDRLERFAADFSAPAGSPAAAGPRLAEDLQAAGQRFAVGLFKKFVLADTLALAALNPLNAQQAQPGGWLWLMLYLYAFQIYFDFSGYTDIAIGMGRALGVRLPENFAAPYAKPNLTQFWNAWHISLTQWFRAYFFNPFLRWLRKAGRALPQPVLVLLPQLATMLLIGLWHGVTVNFAVWGLWHGLGLFAQNRWTEATRGWFAARTLSPQAQRGLQAFSTLLTFHYVALGWVWFVLPRPALALDVLRRLLGGE